jgi:hypothetical protein
MATTATIVNELIATGRKLAKRQVQRFPDAASIGDAVRQGDIYITLLDALPKGAKKLKTFNLQLAPGTTQGSRHILDSSVGVTAYTLANATEFDGPILKLKSERTIQHPEHGDYILPPRLYAISYQRTQDAMDRARRVQD